MRRFVLILLLAAVAGPLVGDDADVQDRRSLADFELMQFVASGRMPPQRVIDLDNNSEVLVACRTGCTSDDLEQIGIDVTASQFQLMQLMNLVRPSQGSWYTNFPILDADQTTSLRSEAEMLAAEAVAELRTEIEALARSLSDRGLELHAFPVFFSYVFDGMVWGFLEEYQRVPRRALSARRPFWAGEIWALAPVREGRAGTMVISERGMTMKILTSSQVESSFGPLVAGHRLVKSAMAELARDEQISSAETIALLERFGIVDGDGDFDVPVIEPLTGEDPVFEAAESLTSAFVDWMLERVEFDRLKAAYGFRGDSQALVVLYHELMASLMSILEHEGVVSRPAVLGGVPEDSVHGLGQLVVVVDRAITMERDDDESTRTDAEAEGGGEQ